MKIENLVLDKERALYNLKDSTVDNCTFDGPADGESALKECRNVQILDCSFNLRYPLWHNQSFYGANCHFSENCRAAIWYSTKGNLVNCQLHGIKALRECTKMRLANCDVVSQEFAWFCNDLKMENCNVGGEYFLFCCKDVKLKKVNLTGKYSLQYLQNAEITDCYLDTKDALWHAKNVVVKNSVIKGEYLGWFCENVTFVNCKIIGTQPLCYCKKLKLVNCTMEDCDLSFEYSDTVATLNGFVMSVKNPKSGKIVADSIGEIIWDDSIMKNKCKVISKDKK